jgi:hypothetical protein
MFEGVVVGFEGVLAGFDPVGVPLGDVEAVWVSLDRIERLAAGAKLRLAGRVEEAGGWRRDGRRSAADHLALLSGSSVGAARGQLEASKQLAGLPVVADAVAAGVLSAAQVQVIADAAAVAPFAQGVLVAAAKRESLSELRDRCGRTKAAADRDAEARHARIHAARCLRKRSCPDGAAELVYRSTPDEVAEVLAVAERFADRLFRAAHRAGTPAPAEAHLADALLLMARRAATGTPAPAPGPADAAARPAEPARQAAHAQTGDGDGDGDGEQPTRTERESPRTNGFGPEAGNEPANPTLRRAAPIGSPRRTCDQMSGRTVAIGSPSWTWTRSGSLRWPSRPAWWVQIEGRAGQTARCRCRGCRWICGCSDTTRPTILAVRPVLGVRRAGRIARGGGGWSPKR